MKQSLKEKIINYQRENGTRKLLIKAFKIAIFSYQKEVVGCLSVTAATINASPKVLVTVRAAEISDIHELKILTANYKKRDFLQWINDKYIFYIAQLKDSATSIKTPNTSIIGYICVCPAIGHPHKLVSVLKLKDTDYWAVDAYIHPAYRGKGINSAIVSGFIAQAKSEGFKRGYGTILFDNSASRRSYTFIGEKEIGIFTTIRIFGFNFYSLKRIQGNDECFN